MANILTTLNQTQSATPGTLSSSGLYVNPNIPRNSQAKGIQGTDNRAYTRSVTNDELVRNQLTDLLADDSKYIDLNRADARRFAATRGLGNSSIAAGAGVRAAIQSALPIAQQDAATYAATQAANMDALNQGTMQERQIANEQLAAAREAQMRSEAIGAANQDAMRARQLQLQLQREALAFEGEQAALGREHELGRMGYEFNLQDMFANNTMGRDLTRMGAEYEWRDRFANNDAARQDWLSGNEFNRNFYGQMSQLFASSQLNSTADMFNMLNAYSLENPDIFNAEDYQRFTGVVNQVMGNSFGQIMARIFGGG